MGIKSFYNNHLRKYIPVIITVILTVIFTILLGEPIKQAFTNYFSKKEIHYKIISTAHLTAYTLYKYKKAEGISFFNLNLDDPILKDYYVLKIELVNKGVAIKDNLKFHVSIGNKFVKILDIKHKIKTPSHKVLSISHSIPDLTWALDKSRKTTLSWTPVTENVDGTPYTDHAGYNIYRSKFKHVGYGKINEHLIKNTSFDLNLPEKEISPYYYTLTAVDLSGNEGTNFSDYIPLPGASAFRKLFKEVIWVKPDVKLEKRRNGSWEHAYHSLKEAIEREGKTATFLINKHRGDIVNQHNLLDKSKGEIKVLYLDDLSFLDGKAEIYLTSGIDEDAKIVFYFLCKILPIEKYIHDLNLVLEGNPDIKLFKRNIFPIKYGFHTDNKKVIEETDIKYSLTPLLVTAYTDYDTIYLSWKYPINKAYKGVRIFRYEKSHFNDKNKLGEEIYDGEGNIGSFVCESKKSKVYSKSNSYTLLSKNFPPDNPPPRKKSVKKSYPTPAPPTITIVEVKYDKKQQLYFADNDASSGVIYTYILYTYDDKNNFSYPILVNASLDDISSVLKCYPSTN